MSITDEWINQTWSIQTMEYYSATKKNEGLIHVRIWMSSENTTLSERNQTQKATCCAIPFT